MEIDIEEGGGATEYVAADEIAHMADEADDADGGMDLDDDEDMDGKTAERPSFPALTAEQMHDGRIEIRRIRVPQNRMTPLKADWEQICEYVVTHMLLQIQMNLKTKHVEIRNSKSTEDPVALQKTEDFLKAYMMGFDLADAVALLRLDDLYIESFEVEDVKMLKGDHLARAVGRIAGHQGKTKHTIENATRTRIVVADKHVHVLGSYANIQVAKDALSSLIMGTPPGKVYNQMRHVAGRLQQRM